MKVLGNYILLSDLARELEVTNQSLRNHLTNGSGLGVYAEKLGKDWILTIDSVLVYLDWAFSHSKQLSYATIKRVKEEIECQRKV